MVSDITDGTMNKRQSTHYIPNTDEYNDPDFLIDTGYDCVEQGEYEEALRLFSMGASIDNSDPDILNGLGITLCELGEYDKSRQVLERSVRHNPDDAITLANLAGVYWELGLTDKSVHCYTRALSLSPDIEEIHYNLINLYMESGSLYMAFLACGDYIREFPDNREARELMEEIILNLAMSLY